MTANPGINLVLTRQAPASSNRRLQFWLVNAVTFLAFFLSVHDLTASQHWLTTDKKELGALKDEEAAGHATRQIGFLLLGGMGIVLLSRGGAVPGQIRPMLMFPLCMLLIWALASSVWSADPALTLKRQVVLLCMLLGAAGLIRQFTIAQLAEIVVVQSLVVILLGIIVESILGPVLPITNSEYRFGGTLHPNHMGINASLLLLCSLFLARAKEDRRFFVLSLIALMTLLMTKSRTALFSAIVGSFVYMVVAYPRRRLAVLALICLAGGLAMVVTSSGILSDLGQTVLMNRGTSDPTTLTGRTMIWQFALDRVRDDWGRIFAGFGYGGFWTPQTALALSQRAQFSLSEGHNGYLDIMLQLGITGLALYLCCILVTLWVCIASAGQHRPQAALAGGLICFALNHHLAESALTAPGLATLILWFIIGSTALGSGFAPEAVKYPLRINIRRAA
jgi:O-antigen ligase